MPNERTHSYLTIAAAIAAGATAIALRRAGVLELDQELVFIAVSSAILGDLFLSPDLDHTGRTTSTRPWWRWIIPSRSGSRAYQLWGPLRWIWYPYRELLPHRSPISHWPIIGTLGRVTYLFGTPLIGAHLAGADLAAVLTAFWPEISAALVGLEASASLHFLADRRE